MRVSVIVANYNCGKYIGTALHSLVNQSMPRNEYEVIVVDDGSTDGSMQAIERYRPFIRLIALPHRGHCAACNEGFRLAQGQYIVRVDADDYVNHRLLELEALFLEENKAFDAVSCDYWKVDGQGNWMGRESAARNPIACGVMFKYDIGMYDEGKSIWEDTDFVSRLASVYNIPLPLYRYRQRNDSLTHKESHGVTHCGNRA